MLRRLIALVVLIVIAVAECVDVDLSALVVAQGRLLEQMQQQIQSLNAVVNALTPAEQQGREQGAAMPEYFDSGLGRLLTAAPDTQRKTWHHSIVHSFDVPTSCGLHAELNSDATGPMDITRLSDGNVTMGYGGAASASQPAAFEMNHPQHCRTATLTSNHPLVVTGSLTVTGLQPRLNGQPVGNGYAVLKCRGTGSGVFGGTLLDGSAAWRHGKPAQQHCAKAMENPGRIEMHGCNLDQSQLQIMWFGKMLQTKNNKCFQVQMSDGKVLARDYCNNDEGNGDTTYAEDMYFYFEGEQIRNVASMASNTRWQPSLAVAAKSDACMQCGPDPVNTPTNGGVYMKPCDGSNNQRWYWWRPGDPNP